MTMMYRTCSLILLRILILVWGFKEASSSPPDCLQTSDCEKIVGRVSECREDGKCSNPLERGCLQAYLPGWKKLRTCNSEDPPDAQDQGLCRIPDFSYNEIRIFSQNWESAMFEAWILQIVLGELLDVPATIETGFPDKHLNLYDPNMPFDYGGFNDWEGLTRAHDILDCRFADRSIDNYESCCHLIPEVWHGHLPVIQGMAQRGILEPAQGLGAIGKQDWFMPKFAGERDPTLLSYLGMQGEGNRRKLAETFLRPTTWNDYCKLVSQDNCTSPDSVAMRAPLDETEEKRMFVEGLYTGHFRKTEKNDCDKNPTTCTGHIADYPCGWTSFLKPQTYHLNIALESDGDVPNSNGYEYSQLVEMWHAANATKSPMIMMWWTPEALYQDFMRTDAEFTKISLPPPTQECWANGIVPEDRCVEDFHTRVGDPRGACEEVANPLHMALSRGLEESVFAFAENDVDRSPANDAVSQFTISGLQMGELFEYWKSMTSPREAICQWTVDNLDFLVTTMVPNTYPRVVVETSDWSPLFYASVILGLISTILVVLTSWMVFERRDKRVIKFAQVEFLMILLLGLCIISVGAVIVGFPPSDASCVAAIWLINVGYTLELVPLIVKVAAINRLMLAAQNMRRVVLRRDNLFGVVVVISALVVVFLVTWTVVDPPHKVPEYVLTDETTEANEAIVTSVYYCSSDSPAWEFASLSWNVLLLICATVLAFQTRKVVQDFNESQTLAIMIYSHFVFVLLRVITFLLSSSVSQAVLARCRSLIYSVDTIITILIYFWPKFAVAAQPERRRANFADPPSGSGTMMMTTRNPVHRLIDQLRSRTTSVVDGRQSMTILEAEATDGRENDDDGSDTCEECPPWPTKAPQGPRQAMEGCSSASQSPQRTMEISTRSSLTDALTNSTRSSPCSQCGHIEVQPLKEKSLIESQEVNDSHNEDTDS